MSILVINAGSSSVKFGLFDEQGAGETATGLIDWTAKSGKADLVIRSKAVGERRQACDVSDHAAAVKQAIRAMQDAGPSAITAVGHRVVHGGTVFHESVRIDGRVKGEITRLSELAPLHNPPALEALTAAEAALPGVPHVAVFDTAFFAKLPPSAHVYPLPYEWYEAWGVRRFGFHGISHAYCARRAAEMLGRADDQLRLVTCHLGNGCSASAIRGGRAVATTMGFTPIEGLMMGSRPGSIDPGILLHVQRRHGISADQLHDVLNHRSGLLGVSGVSSDYRPVEEAAQQGHERARLALAMYAERVRSTIGALAVGMGGLDALVFTAGVGEHSAGLRASACAGLECLGLRLDAAKNAGCRPDADIAEGDSAVRILVMHTREEQMIAREVLRVVTP